MKTPGEERRRRNWCQPHCVGASPALVTEPAWRSIAPHARSLATRALSRPTLAMIARGRPAPELIFSLLSETIWGGKEEKELRRTRRVGLGESGDGKTERMFSFQERQAADVPLKGPQEESLAWPCQCG